jgi:hypothetical protein
MFGFTNSATKTVCGKIKPTFWATSRWLHTGRPYLTPSSLYDYDGWYLHLYVAAIDAAPVIFFLIWENICTSGIGWAGQLRLRVSVSEIIWKLVLGSRINYSGSKTLALAKWPFLGVSNKFVGINLSAVYDLFRGTTHCFQPAIPGRNRRLDGIRQTWEKSLYSWNFEFNES